MKPSNYTVFELTNIEEKEIVKGFKGKFIHTTNNTLAYWQIEKGAILPVHSHIHEQVTQLLTGEFELTIDGETNIYKNGNIVIIPANVLHGGKAITDCTIFDIFSPVREDYK
jgi:quercetin dioxygenase-like cupin family protein